MSSTTTSSNSVSSKVTTLIIIVTLFIEAISFAYILHNYTKDHNHFFGKVDMFLILLLIVALLIHQFFIIDNFHKMDHLSEGNKELSDYGLTNWFNSATERSIRYFIFLVFALIELFPIYNFIIFVVNS